MCQLGLWHGTVYEHNVHPVIWLRQMIGAQFI